MSLLIADSVTKSFGTHDVLRNVSFRLAESSRVGLVGPNGEGKTTLLKIIAGVWEPTSGQTQRSRGLVVGYLPQDPPALEGATLHQAMLDVFADHLLVERQLHEMAQTMDDGDEAAIARFGQLQTAFDARGGYDYLNRIETVLTGLGFTREQWNQSLATLSGGQRTRGYLAGLLLRQPDLLLLDEPTNHLDLESVEWLERWLASYNGGLVVVSHDRYFLNAVTDETWEVAFGTLEQYRGAYSQYVGKREQRYEERMTQWQAQQKYIEDTQEFIRRFIAGQRSKEAQGRRTRLERFIRDEAIPQPRRHPRINVRFTPAMRTGDLVLRLTDLQAGYAPHAPLVQVENLEMRRGQRVAVVGPNGCGKTTLVRTVLGKLPPLAGKVTPGAHVRVGYLSQTHEELKPDMTVLEAVRSVEGGLKEEQARNLLGSLLFTGNDVLKRVCELSGGQRSRVILARLIAQNANVLVLDEPTNHLDIASQEVLQEVLGAFEGTILFVSHDRYLIQALATELWAVHDATVKVLSGRWEDYLAWRSQQAAQPATPRGNAPSEGAQAYATRKDEHRQRKQQQNQLARLARQQEKLEADIHALEAELAQLTADISAAGERGDMKAVADLGAQYQQKNQSLESLMAQWEEVSGQLEA